MAARLRTNKFTFTGTSHLLSELFTSSLDGFIGSLTIRAKASNAGNTEWSDSGGSSGGFLEPGEAASFDLTQKYIKTSDLILTGTIGDILYVTVIS